MRDTIRGKIIVKERERYRNPRIFRMRESCIDFVNSEYIVKKVK